MLTLYEHPQSPCCQKVRFFLAEKGIPFTGKFVDIQNGENLHESFLKLNPKAQVPVLVHEVDGKETVITESTIICEYLEDYFSETPIYPVDPRDRATARLWALTVDTGLHVPHTATLTFTILFREQLLAMLDTPEKQYGYLSAIKNSANREARKETLERGYESPYFLHAIRAFESTLQAMEAQLEETKWLAGEFFSYGDIVMAPYIKRLVMIDLGEMLTPYPNILTWYETLSQRESWQKEVEGEGREFVEMFREGSKGAWEKVKPLLSEI